ncbi:MAG: M24 family metallopeptidase [Lachnospiraceae bacterium]|nr:M24 family metallopeptidase [Lachnospiraceae bacterium]
MEIKRVSVSGKDYTTSERVIESNDIITIDLSPQIGDTWGDYARTVIIENGYVVKSVNEIKSDEWRNGLLMEKKLHDKMIEIVNSHMTFEDLYFRMNEYIKADS